MSLNAHLRKPTCLKRAYYNLLQQMDEDNDIELEELYLYFKNIFIKTKLVECPLCNMHITGYDFKRHQQSNGCLELAYENLLAQID